MTSAEGPNVFLALVIRNIRIALVCVASTLSACSGGGGSGSLSQAAQANILPPTTQPTASATAAPSKVAVHLTYQFADKNTAAVIRRTQSAVVRRLQYISGSNTLLSITVTPLGGSSTVYGPTSCTTASCAISFTATPGPNTIAFTFTDGSSNVLSTFSTTTIVQPATVNTLNFTANPVVASAAVSLASSTINAGTAANVVVTINAKDTDGNTIVAPGNFVDANGNPISLSVTTANNQLGGSGTVTINGQGRISGPTSLPLYAHYDGNWMSTGVISIIPTSTLPGGITPATLTIRPYAAEYAAAGGVFGITAGPDGNIWFTEFIANRVGKMSTSGASLALYTCGACSNLDFIVPGADGNLWLAAGFSGTVGKMNTNGGYTLVASTANPNTLITGIDGAVWYGTDTSGAGGVGFVSPSGATNLFPAPSNDAIRAIAFGPDGNLWYLDKSANKIGKMNRNGVTLATYSTPTLGPAADGMVTGPDNNLWFGVYNSNIIERCTVGGTLTTYTLQTGAQPRSLVVGPDGRIWFTESGTNSIGNVDVNSGVVTEYGTVNGISATSSPVAITVGPDGNIWFTEFGTNKIAKFVL